MKRALFIILASAGFTSAQLITTNLETGIILFPVKDAATHEMIRASLREKDPLIRIQGIIALQTMQDPADEPLLRQMLQDPVATVREQAAGKKPAAPASLPAADLRSANVLQQQLAVDAIAKSKATDRAADLLPLLDSPDSVLRRHVCEALGALRVEQSAALAKQLGRDDDPFVRRAAAEALLSIHSDAGRDLLIESLKHESASVRTESARALGRWKQPAIVGALHPLLTDADVLVARAAADALGTLNNPESIPALLDSAKTRTDAVQERVCWALGELHATVAVPALLAIVNGPNDSSQTTAAEALGKIGDPQAIPALRKVLVAMRNHSPSTRQRAIESLRKLGDRDSTKRVLQIITEKVVPPPPGAQEPTYDMDDTRAEGLRYLQFVGDPKLADQVLDKLEDLPSYNLRKVLAETVGQLTGKPHRAAFTVDCRHYLLESLGGEFYPKAPPLPGIEPIQ